MIEPVAQFASSDFKPCQRDRTRLRYPTAGVQSEHSYSIRMSVGKRSAHVHRVRLLKSVVVPYSIGISVPLPGNIKSRSDTLDLVKASFRHYPSLQSHQNLEETAMVDAFFCGGHYGIYLEDPHPEHRRVVRSDLPVPMPFQTNQLLFDLDFGEKCGVPNCEWSILTSADEDYDGQM